MTIRLSWLDRTLSARALEISDLWAYYVLHFCVYKCTPTHALTDDIKNQ